MSDPLPKESARVPLPAAGESVGIGRDEANKVVLQSKGVSRFHAEIMKRDGTYLIKDRDSRNGTYVNGERIASVTLQPGDLIQIGSTRALFRFDGNCLEMVPDTAEQLETASSERRTRPGAARLRVTGVRKAPMSGVRRARVSGVRKAPKSGVQKALQVADDHGSDRTLEVRRGDDLTIAVPLGERRPPARHKSTIPEVRRAVARAVQKLGFEKSVPGDLSVTAQSGGRLFRFYGMGPDQSPVFGTIRAENVSQALDVLTANRVKVIEIRPLVFGFHFFDRAQVPHTAVVMMTRRLATLTNAGVTLIRALEVLTDQEENQELKGILVSIRCDVNSGSTLSWALSKHPEVFGSMYVTMVKIGGATGQMSALLERLADFLERDMRMRQQMRSALTYPCFVLAICLFVFGLVFLYVLPPMLDVFAAMAPGALPLPTRMLMAMVRFLTNPWIELALVLLVVFYYQLVREYLATADGRFTLEQVKRRLPLVGTLWKKNLVADFCRGMGLLLTAGVPMLKSLSILAEFMGNEYFKRIVAPRIATGVREGEHISDAMVAAGFFPQMAVAMVKAGEASGSVADIFIRCSRIYEAEVQEFVEQMLVLLEPIIIAIMGVLVCFILLAVFMPLYQLIMKLD